ncbi:MAG: hypothetical protein JSR73_13730 [Proteobacteria bacterium]|nr:hypothetical protein [Pseudomonadota bacterium]
MSPMPADAWMDAWRRFAAGAGAGPSAAPAGAGGEAIAEAFQRFAATFAALARPGAGLPTAELESLARDFFQRALPAWPPGAGEGPEWTQALAAWTSLLAEVARATAAAFAARLAAPGAPTTLRGAFDAWIDAAESAFRATAHSAEFAGAQARLFNSFVRAKARQQALLEQVARAAGAPTRREVDALYDEVRTLRAELAATREPVSAPAPAPAPKAGASTAPARPRARRPRTPR